MGLHIGNGYDVHRLERGLPFILGGIQIRHEAGLSGHSDADVATHALMDALLNAAKFDDIGSLFPNTDPVYKGISSLLLLKKVAATIYTAGYSLVDSSIVIVAQEPKIAPYREAMREALATAMNVDIEKVGISATTTEGLGFEGEKKGISAHAVALLED